MKHLIILILCLGPLVGFSQGDNIFHDREFWKTKPSVSVVQQKIAEGHDAIALDDNAFDAVTNAINNMAPMATIQYLLSLEGNEVNKVTHDGRNYVMWAARTGNIELVKYLLEKGSKTDITDSHGYNLLTFPAAAGRTDVALYDLILEKGIPVDATNRSGANVLHLLASSITDTKMLTYFMEKGLDLESLDEEGNGIFHYAARGGNVDLMKILVNKGISFQSLNHNGENAVFFASMGGRGSSNPISVFQYLEKLGLEIDVVNWSGQTPLHFLARSIKENTLLDYFRSKGVNIHQVDNEGNTVFLNAVAAGNPFLVEALLPEIKDLNYVNHAGQSALLKAVQSSATPLIKLLLEKGADSQIVDGDGNGLAYHLFNGYNRRNQSQFGPIFDLLKEYKVSFQGKYAEGNNLVHIAVEKGSETLLKKALSLGVEVNQRNNDGLSPLHLAAMKARDHALINILLTNGADKSITTDFGETAYDLAMENEALAGNEIEFLK